MKDTKNINQLSNENAKLRHENERLKMYNQMLMNALDQIKSAYDQWASKSSQRVRIASGLKPLAVNATAKTPRKTTSPHRRLKARPVSLRTLANSRQKTLKEERTKVGLSQKIVAQRMGISKSYYSELEGGARKVSEQLLMNFRKALKARH